MQLPLEITSPDSLPEPPSPNALAWNVQDLTSKYLGPTDIFSSIILKTLCNTYYLTEFPWLVFQHFICHAENLISISIFSTNYVISILLVRQSLLRQIFQMEMRNHRIKGMYTKQPEAGIRDIFLNHFSILILKQGLSWNLELTG